MVLMSHQYRRRGRSHLVHENEVSHQTSLTLPINLNVKLLIGGASLFHGMVGVRVRA